MAAIEEKTTYAAADAVDEKTGAVIDVAYPTSVTESSEAAPAKPMKWYQNIYWYEPGMSKQEKKLVFKLDCLILTYTCLASFALNLDTSNVKNAYVSGMKEDLHLYGNELNYLTVINQAPYCVFMIPGTLLITKYRASVLLPACEIGWGVFTLVTTWVHNVNTLYAFRFFVGFFACISYAGSVYIIGSWYKKSEISRRLGLYAMSNPLGGMFSGYLQSAAYSNLDGKNGLAGWRWLFIICTIITIPIAIWGAFAIPDAPSTTRCLLLTKSDVELARRRMANDGTQATRASGFRMSTVLKCLAYWKWYAFVGAWCLLDQNEQGLSVAMNLYLKAHSDRFTVPQINNIPTVTSAVSVVSTILATYVADKTRNQFWPAYVSTVLFCIANYMLLAWNISEHAKFFAWFISGVEMTLQALLMTWASIETRADADERAFIVASMNCLGNLLKTGTNVVCFPTVDAPRFYRGYLWMSITGSMHLFWLPAIKFLTAWEHKKQKRLEVENPGGNSIMDEASDSIENENSGDGFNAVKA